MNPFENTVFMRRFSANPYKSLYLPLGEMSCAKDWINTKRGDPYPVLENTGATESVSCGHYRALNKNAQSVRATRLIGGHFPICTYEMTLFSLTGGAGFEIDADGKSIRIIARHDGEKYIISVKTSSGTEEKFEFVRAFVPGTRFMVTANTTYFELFIAEGETPEFAGLFNWPEFAAVARYSVYSRSTAAVTSELECGESAEFTARFYLDCGVSQADLRSVTYEDGTPIIEHGRMFLTFSVRNVEKGFQGVMSWTPGLNDFRMEGALFFNPGDGTLVGNDSICGDVATTLVYDRNNREWLLWACSFSHGHILCHTRMKNDPRFGINVLDVELMKAENEKLTLSDDRLFLAKTGDEDPDLIWDEKNKRWILSICRVVEAGEGTQYRYFLFESDDPFEGFKYIGNTVDGSGTGGSLIEINGKRYLLSGANFNKRANYYLYPLDDLAQHTMLKFNYDDGGFRGWGTFVQVPAGTRTRRFLITFDRHNGGTGNWTYGNLYVFEAVDND